MGADLILASFTYDPAYRTDTEAFRAALDNPETLRRAHLLVEEQLPWIADDDEDGERLRMLLLEGLVEYEAAIRGHRFTNAYEVGDTGLVFVVAGGATWGDDPFDGFTALSVFIDLLGVEPDLRALTNLVGGAIHTETGVIR